MKSFIYAHGRVFGISVLLSISVTAAAAGNKPAPPPPPSHPAYHPAPSHPSYNPAPSHSSYNPAPAHPSYSPQSSSGGGFHPSTQQPSSSSHTFTPGAQTGGGAQSFHPSSGATTYTPHVYTPGATSTGAATEAGATHSVGGSTEGVHSANGVTTYTPHASGGTSYTPAATHSYSPSAPEVTHGSSYTPAATGSNASSSAEGGSSYTPHNSAQRNTFGGNTHSVYNVPGSAAGKPGASTLSAAGSQSVLHQVNTARTGLTGVNHHSIPSGQVSVHSDKSLTVSATNGRQYNLRADGTLASFSAHGNSASFRADGRLASVHTPGMDIAHGPHGERTIVSQGADHSRLVSTGAHSGYRDHQVDYHGHSYLQRSYWHGGHSFTRNYYGYHYHGAIFYDYLPFYYYDPLFYGWAYYPWGAPVPYGWGWAASPWFAFYAGFFSPWDVYPSGAYWLTDYYLSQTLESGYQQGYQAGASQAADDAAAQQELEAPADSPITPEIKQMIADEVQQQLAYENAAAAKPDDAAQIDGLPQVLVANHLFVVDQALNAVTADGQQCSLSVGDVIKLVSAPADGVTTADLIVVSSRKSDCPAGIGVSLPLENLEEMHNNFRAQIDSGLQTLHTQQGQGGLPAAPQSAIAPPPRPADMPPADSENLQSQLDAQQQQADQTENSVTKAAFSSPQATAQTK